MPSLHSKLPSLYHTLFPELASLEAPTESFATCENCVLCQKPDSPFLDTKCCTYYPQLPNYFIGGILSDSRPELQEGKQRLRALIQAGHGVTPTGLVTPLRYDLLNTAIRTDKSPAKGNEWTKAEVDTLRCPFYDQGACTVWDYREHGCSTSFCKSVGGETGTAFWNSLSVYLTDIEDALARYVLVFMNFPADTISAERLSTQNLGLDSAVGEVNAVEYKRLWGSWAGKEEVFYVKAFELVRDLDQTQLSGLLGVKGAVRWQQLLARQQQFLTPEIPDWLVLSDEVTIEKLAIGEVELKTTQGTFVVPGLVYHFLTKLDTKYTVDAVDQTLNALGVEFKKEYLTILFHLKILRPGQTIK
ncbi:hypothetical protein [Arundinibacter roseus]|uniref:Uncharacterized protein n=1 Tax=Arundinibacter roseus TaxID=2070510 RepID=A0A4R4K3K4_9BACT|nr:hypothetical protein [Arundinibacter roseus]TDB61142.1 hypothetical protein EZE20_19955 [Arundinibacter roseus]